MATLEECVFFFSIKISGHLKYTNQKNTYVIPDLQCQVEALGLKLQKAVTEMDNYKEKLM